MAELNRGKPARQYRWRIYGGGDELNLRPAVLYDFEIRTGGGGQRSTRYVKFVLAPLH